MATLPDDELLDLREVAGVLRIGRATIQRWAKQRKLPAVKVGKSYRLRRSDLESWYEQQRVSMSG